MIRRFSLAILLTSCLIPSAFAQLTLEQRVQVLEDREAIRTLLLSYGRLVDERNWSGFADLFASGTGTWDGGMGVASGQNAIIDMMQSTMGADNSGTNGNGISNLHLLSNEFIDVSGDSATALSKWAFIMTAADNGPEVMFLGHYEDTLIREAGVWKFARRKVFSDIARPVQLPGLPEK